MSYKKSFLVTSKILGLLINKLTADYEYSRSNKENLPPPIYMQLPKKPKTFCVVIEFLESTLNLEHFEKKMSLIAQVFLKLLTPKDVVTLMSLNVT